MKKTIPCVLFLLVTAALVSGGCGKKSDDTAASPSSTPNPAAVAPVVPAAGAPGARGSSPEADAYRAKMGANAKAPGAR